MDVDISQRLQAISLPFTDCALNEASMNECKFWLSISRSSIFLEIITIDCFLARLIKDK